MIKNFFVDRPVELEKITKENIIEKYSNLWMRNLIDEIRCYPDIPILTLGEPILSSIVNDSVCSKVNNY